ncbi:small heat shock protein [Boletus coccyginus]|nr:small heat shock protein [Boletus coccyginus]
MTSKAIKILSQVASRLRPSVSVDIRKRIDLSNFRPRMDVHESKDASTVTATFELPGMKSNDVNIDVHQNRLTVAGEAKQSHSHEEGYVVRERSYGKFSRMLQLPSGIKPDDVRAKMENGVLTVTFPKTTSRQQQGQGQRIVIR